jgi:hypothetical protein
MKTYSIALFTAALALLAGCSTAYRTGQTPDAVYAPAGTAAPSGGAEAVSGDNRDAGTYVTYDNDQYNDGDYYNSSTYGQPYGLYSFNDMYLGPSYLGLGYGSLGWNPFMWSYPSLSMAWTFGSPWGRWYPYGFGSLYPYEYSPWYAYNPYFPGYYGGYYGGLYRHGYYYGGYGYGGKYLSQRPANSYAPRNSYSSRARAAEAPERTSGNNVTSSPRRVFRSNDNGNATTRPRRIFRSNPDEHPIGVNPGTRTETRQPSRTINRQSENNYRRTETRPQPQQRVYRPEPQQRSYQQNNSRVERSAPSYNSTPSYSAPSRTFSPRGRR